MRIVAKRLVEQLDVLWTDVQVGLACCRYVQVCHSRTYDPQDALRAMAAHYDRRIADNDVHLAKSGAKVFSERIERYRERQERVRALAREWGVELDAGR